MDLRDNNVLMKKLVMKRLELNQSMLQKYKNKENKWRGEPIKKNYKMILLDNSFHDFQYMSLRRHSQEIEYSKLKLLHILEY